jgi:hypothetical protein
VIKKIYQLQEIIKSKFPITKPFKRSFKLSEGFYVEDLIIKGKGFRINKYMEGNKTKLLYGPEGLSKERRDYLQEIIDKWTEEGLQERKEECRNRASKTKSPKKQLSMNKIIGCKYYSKEVYKC